MTIQMERKEFIKSERNTQKRCVELLGNGKFSVKMLKDMVENLKQLRDKMKKSCLSTVETTVQSYGGVINKEAVPMVTKSSLYENIQYLIITLTAHIDIAQVNGLETIIDFSFTDEQILNYGMKYDFVM